MWSFLGWAALGAILIGVGGPIGFLIWATTWWLAHRERRFKA